MPANRQKTGLSKADRIAIWSFLRTRQASGTLDWSGLLGRNDSPRQRAADLHRAVNAAIARFLKKVHFDTVAGCWEWTGARLRESVSPGGGNCPRELAPPGKMGAAKGEASPLRSWAQVS